MKIYVGYNIDVVMCIDVSSSMSPVIDWLKNHVCPLEQRFDDYLMNEYGREINQMRIKVITFRNYGGDDEPMVESPFYVLPDQQDGFTTFMNAIVPTGDGDAPKNALEAIALALKSDWTTGGNKRRHIILLFSDAPVIPLGESSSLPSYPNGMPKDLEELRAWLCGTNQSFTGMYQSKVGSLITFVPNSYPWKDMEAWSRYYPMYILDVKNWGEEYTILTVYDLIMGMCENYEFY